MTLPIPPRGSKPPDTIDFRDKHPFVQLFLETHEFSDQIPNLSSKILLALRDKTIYNEECKKTIRVAYERKLLPPPPTSYFLEYLKEENLHFYLSLFSLEELIQNEVFENKELCKKEELDHFFLSMKNLDVNIPLNSRGDTPFTLAANEHDSKNEIISEFFKKGANIDSVLHEQGYFPDIKRIKLYPEFKSQILAPLGTLNEADSKLIETMILQEAGQPLPEIYDLLQRHPKVFEVFPHHVIKVMALDPSNPKFIEWAKTVSDPKQRELLFFELVENDAPLQLIKDTGLNYTGLYKFFFIDGYNPIDNALEHLMKKKKLTREQIVEDPKFDLFIDRKNFFATPLSLRRFLREHPEVDVNFMDYGKSFLTFYLKEEHKINPELIRILLDHGLNLKWSDFNRRSLDNLDSDLLLRLIDACQEPPSPEIIIKIKNNQSPLALHSLWEKLWTKYQSKMEWENLLKLDPMTTAHLMSLGVEHQTTDKETLRYLEAFKRSSLTPALTAVNLAHLVGDAYLDSVRKLGGNNFRESIRFLDLTIQNLKNQFPEPKIGALEKVSQKLNVNLSLMTRLESLPMNLEFAAKNIEILEEDIKEKIKNLEPGETFLIPSGWIGSTYGSGHAMLIEFEKKADGNIHIRVFNTGAGVATYHEMSGAQINTIREYAISLEDISNTAVIRLLLEPQAFINANNESDIYKESDIYEILRPFQTRSQTINSNVWMHTQLSGTCTFRCVLAYMSYSLGKDVYKTFKSHANRKIIQEVVDLYSENLRDHPDIENILALTLPDSFRNLNKLMYTSEIPFPILEDELKRLERTYEIFKSQTSLSRTEHTTIALDGPCVSQASLITAIYRDDETSGSESSHTTPTKISFKIPDRYTDAGHVLQTLENLKKYLQVPQWDKEVTYYLFFKSINHLELKALDPTITETLIKGFSELIDSYPRSGHPIQLLTVRYGLNFLWKLVLIHEDHLKLSPEKRISTYGFFYPSIAILPKTLQMVLNKELEDELLAIDQKLKEMAGGGQFFNFTEQHKTLTAQEKEFALAYLSNAHKKQALSEFIIGTSVRDVDDWHAAWWWKNISEPHIKTFFNMTLLVNGTSTEGSMPGKLKQPLVRNREVLIETLGTEVTLRDKTYKTGPLVPKSMNLICAYHNIGKVFLACRSAVFDKGHEALALSLLIDAYSEDPFILLNKDGEMVFIHTLFQPFFLTEALKQNPKLRAELLDTFVKMKEIFLAHAESQKKEESWRSYALLLNSQARLLQWGIGDPQAVREEIKKALNVHQEQEYLYLLYTAWLDSYNGSEITSNDTINILFASIKANQLDVGMHPHFVQTAQLALAKIQTPSEEQLHLLSERLGFKFLTTETAYPRIYMHGIDTLFEINLTLGALKKDGVELKESKNNSEVHQIIKAFGVTNQTFFVNNQIVETEDRLGKVKFSSKQKRRQIDGEWYEWLREKPPLPLALSGHNVFKSLCSPYNLVLIKDGSLEIISRIDDKGLFKHYWDSANRYEWIDTASFSPTLYKFDPEATVWKAVDSDHRVIEINKDITFETQLVDGQKRFVWRQNPHLFLAEDQQFRGIRNLEEALVLEDSEGNRSLLVKHDKEFMTVPLKNDFPSTQEPYKNAVLALKCLQQARHPYEYQQALAFLKKSYRYEAYSESERTVLEAILTSVLRDKSGYALTIELYASYLLHHALPLDILDRYVAKRSKIPPHMRIENLISPLELSFSFPTYQFIEQSLTDVTTSTVEFAKYSIPNFYSKDLTKLSRLKFDEETFDLYINKARSTNPSDRKEVEEIIRGLSSRKGGEATIRLILKAALAEKDNSSIKQAVKNCIECVKNSNSRFLNSYLSPLIEKFEKHDYSSNKVTRTPFVQTSPVQLPSQPPLTEPLKSEPSFKSMSQLRDLFGTILRLKPVETAPPSTPFVFQSEERYIQSRLQQFNTDNEIGRRKNASLARFALLDGHSPSEIKEPIQIFYSEEKHKQENILVSILHRANVYPSDAKKAFTEKTSRIAGHKKTLEIPDLVALYLQASEDEYRKKTYLTSSEEIAKLHEAIGQYMATSLTVNHAKKILSEIEAWEKKPNPDSLQVIGELLNIENYVDFTKDPSALLVFQYGMNLFLKGHQVRGLREMFYDRDLKTFPDILLQRLQGGGKTLTFGHIMAFLKADGYHLSVHVIPTPQYETAIYDMRHLSQNVFGQREQTLRFDDDPRYFTVVYLSQSLELLKNSIVEREYVTTTKETLQALRTKYLKVCFSKEPPPERELLKQILSLLKERGAFTFDEAHMAFDPTKLLNMPSGETFCPDPDEVRILSDAITIALSKRSLKVEEQSEVTQVQQRDINEAVVAALATRWPEIDPARLRKYWLGNDETLPTEWINKPHLIVLVRQLLHGKWLYDRMNNPVNEFHGFSLDNPGLQISIPFYANMKPLEQSEFSDRHVMMINTLLAYAYNSLSSELWKSCITYYKNAANKEWDERFKVDRSFSIKDTDAYRFFESATGMNIFATDEKDPDSLKAFTDQIPQFKHRSLPLVFEYISKKVFPEVRLFSSQTTSNGQNTASMAKVVQGYSGSFDNTNLMDVPIQLDEGVNGQTVDRILSQNRDVWITKSPAESIFSTFMATHPEKDKIRMFTDVGCHFRGIENVDVARMIAKYLRDTQSEMKGVLYFNGKGKLCFMTKTLPESTRELSGTTPEIIAIETGLKPEERFTYLSQMYFTGIDILQARDTVGIVTNSKDTQLFMNTQGSRRLRGLDHSQGLIFTFPQSDLEVLGPIKTVTNRDLILYSFIKMVKEEQTHNFMLAVQKMEDTIQQAILDKMYAADVATEMAIFSRASYLYSKSSQVDLVKAYGQPKTLEEMEAYLKKLKGELINPLRDLFTQEEWEKIEKREDAIIQASLPGLKSHMEVEIKDSTQVQYKEESKQEQIHESRKETHHEQRTTYQAILNTIREKALPERVLIDRHLDGASSSFDAVLTKEKSKSLICDPRLKVTHNYLHLSSHEDSHLTSAYRKPPSQLLLIQDDKGEYTLTLCTIQEAELFEKEIIEGRIPANHKVTLIRPQGKIVRGAPFDLEGKPLELLTQALFYTGQSQKLQREPFYTAFKEFAKKIEDKAPYRDFLKNILLAGDEIEKNRIYRLLM